MRNPIRFSMVWAVGVSVLVTAFLVSARAQPLKEDMEQISVAQEAYDLRIMAKTDEAKELLEEALSTDPDNPVAYFELARTQLYLLNIEGMQSSILHAARLDPGNARYHYFAGLSSIFSIINAAHKNNEGAIRGYALKAIEELETALDIDPEFDDARCTLVEIFSNQPANMGGDPAKAEEHIELLD